MEGGLRIPAAAWLVFGAAILGVALWLSYVSSPENMTTVQVAFDRLVMWGRMILGALAVLGLLMAGIWYLIGHQQRGHRHGIGAVLALAIATVGPTVLHLLGLLFSHLTAQLPAGMP